MKRIGLVVHPSKVEAADAAEKLRVAAGANGIEVVAAESKNEFDLIIALGGDGTILRAAARAVDVDVPLMGINVGRLGYLSTVDAQMLAEAVERLVGDRYLIEERMLLSGLAMQGRTQVTKMIALNEIVVEKSAPARVIDIAVSVDGNRVATYTADGFIVATPTGSTAYSLSAGGPIVEPQHDSIVLTPVSAHSPLWRSIVVRPERVIQLEAARGPAALSSDGQSRGELLEGGILRITKHDRALKLVRVNGYEFFARVRSRFRIEASIDDA